MGRFLSSLILVTCLSAGLCAQPVRHTFGIRAGNHFAVDYKAYFDEANALNLNAGVINPFTGWYQFVTLSGAYHRDFNVSVERLNPYVGAGLSTGVQFGHWNRESRDRITYFMSVDLPVGLEYSLRKHPVTFTLEWSPKFQFLSDLRFIPQSVSIGVRFIFHRS